MRKFGFKVCFWFALEEFLKVCFPKPQPRSHRTSTKATEFILVYTALADSVASAALAVSAVLQLQLFTFKQWISSVIDVLGLFEINVNF